MSWVKQSDTLWRDVDFMELSDGAQALWHRANSYIADQLTDGIVPESALKHLRTRKRYVDELVACGRWVWQPSGGWLAAGWQEIIRSKADVVAKRAEQKQRDRARSANQPAASLLPPGPDPVPVKIKTIGGGTDTSVPANDPATTPLRDLIAKLYCDRYVTKYTVPAPSDDTSTRKVAEWCTEAARLRSCSPAELAERLLDAFFTTKHKRTIDARHRLSFLARDAGEYLPALKPLRSVEDVGARLVREDEELRQRLLAESAQLEAAGAR